MNIEKQEAACAAVLQLIKTRNYATVFLDDGMTCIVKYGIACYKKQCRVKMK